MAEKETARCEESRRVVVVAGLIVAHPARRVQIRIARWLSGGSLLVARHTERGTRINFIFIVWNEIICATMATAIKLKAFQSRFGRGIKKPTFDLTESGL